MITHSVQVLRGEVRTVGAVLRDATITDRWGKRGFWPGSWRVVSCDRYLRYKHWKLTLKAID